MKTKPKNFGNFFVRVGAGFLAFWLLSMGAFSLLLGQQRAELMAADIKDSADWYTGDYARYMLDSKEHEENDPAELRRMLKEQSYQRNASDALMIETAITDQSGNILQSDRWWLTLTDDADTGNVFNLFFHLFHGDMFALHFLQDTWKTLDTPTDLFNRGIQVILLVFIYNMFKLYHQFFDSKFIWT